MLGTKLPFHADHIGSLIRPTSLSNAQSQFDANEISQSELLSAQKAAISDIVHKQQNHNIRALSSGEFDRKYYFSGFFENLQGFREISPVPWDLTRLSAAPIAALKKAGKQYPMAAVCSGKIANTTSPYLSNWLLLRSTVPEEQWADCKFTMPPPCYFHLRLAKGKCYSPSAYANDEEFFADLAKAYQVEIRTLYDAGLRNLQIDDPTLAYFCSEEMLAGLREDGEDTERMFEMYLRAHNACIAGRPEGMHVGLHICRGEASMEHIPLGPFIVFFADAAVFLPPQGNFSKSMHFSEGSYERIAQQFFTTLDYDTFYLEYDNPRSGGFEPLRFLPRDKNVVLGVVTTKEPELEDKEVIIARVREAVRIIAEGQGRSVEEVMENVGVSPQCGFASVAVGAEGMTEERMFGKLALVREVAEELWLGRL